MFVLRPIWSLGLCARCLICDSLEIFSKNETNWHLEIRVKEENRMRKTSCLSDRNEKIMQNFRNVFEKKLFLMLSVISLFSKGVKSRRIIVISDPALARFFSKQYQPKHCGEYGRDSSKTEK